MKAGWRFSKIGYTAMVIRKYHNLKWWLTLAVTCMFISMALPIGVAIWYTKDQLQHECAALSLLTSKPVPKPVNSTDKAREEAYLFYTALSQWRAADGC